MVNHLEACIESSLAGGRSISNYTPESIIKKIRISPVGYHAIKSPADEKSQLAILKRLRHYDPDARLMTEEHIKEESFRHSLIRGIEEVPLHRIYIIDELDGSSSEVIGHHEWSISVGYVDRMAHLAGAVYAPKIDRGTLFYASKDGGTFIRVGVKKKQVEVSECDDLKNAYVLFGPDCFLKKYPVHNALLTELGDVARTTNGIGSCALGLGLVASGRADALVQPLQAPWDWAAGRLLVEEAGGNIIFYEMENGRISPLKSLKPKHYNPDPRIRAVGFVAGNGKITTDIMDMLLRIS